ncbi:MAG: hypothetical protein RRZ84_02560 [Romboutsia sp.]
MNKFQNSMEHMTQDVKHGIGKIGHVLKHTAKDLKDDAQGALASMEMKKDDIIDRYEEKDFSKKIKKQMKKGMK